MYLKIKKHSGFEIANFQSEQSKIEGEARCCKYFISSYTNQTAIKKQLSLTNCLCPRNLPHFHRIHLVTNLQTTLRKSFNQKIRNIRASLDNVTPSTLPVAIAKNLAISFDQFSVVTEEDVYIVVRKSAKKSSALVALPISPLLHVLDDLLPTLTKIINSLKDAFLSLTRLLVSCK